jgi:hypothetical protein
METCPAQPEGYGDEIQQPVDWFLFFCRFTIQFSKSTAHFLLIDRLSIAAFEIFGRSGVRHWYTHEIAPRQTFFRRILYFFATSQ